MNLEFKGKIDNLISEVAAIPDLETKVALLWQLEDEQRIDEDSRDF